MLNLRSAGKEAEGDGGGHGLVAGGGGMQMVAAAVGGEKLVRVLGIVDYAVEVDDGVKVCGRRGSID